MKYKRLEIFASMICLSLTLNIYSITRLSRDTAIDEMNTWTPSPISTIERSKNALNKLQTLMNRVRSPNSQPWIWSPTEQYPSVPYQPTLPGQERVPQPIGNRSIVPTSVNDEIHRVCQRLIRANATRGDIWCQLFRKCYADTLATTTTLLDDQTTYIITGDIDLMWLRDSSAQVHQYMTLADDPAIQRIIEGLIRRQTQFIFANPYGSSFRLTLRPNPPSDDSLQSHHIRKGRNIHVAMHNYELDSLCYYLRLSYTWWNRTQRIDAFNQSWLIAVSIIVQLMIVEQHHSEISPYRYTELSNRGQGTRVSYTGMTWSAFRPSDDPTKFGYLIPSNMMATVVLQQIAHMIKTIFPQQNELLQQVVSSHTTLVRSIVIISLDPSTSC